MKVKLLVPLFLYLFPFSFKQDVLKEPMGINGYITMVDASKDIPIYLELSTGHVFSGVRVDIYVNDTISKTVDTISKYIYQEDYSLPARFKNDEKIKIRIDVYYIDNPDLLSTITLDYYTPSYKDYFFDISSNFETYTVSNVLKTTFYMKGTYFTKSNKIERVSFKGTNTYYVSSNRFINFDNCYFTFSGLSNLTIDYCEIQLDYYFKGSDLLYKRGYSCFDLPLKKVDVQTYQIEDEFQFYMAKKDGSIRYEYSEATYKDLLPFYIPLSVKKGQIINFRILFYDVGYNHNTYVYKGKIIVDKDYNYLGFGSVINYRYQEISTPLEGIVYE